jgi:hypothetical protein
MSRGVEVEDLKVCEIKHSTSKSIHVDVNVSFYGTRVYTLRASSSTYVRNIQLQSNHEYDAVFRLFFGRMITDRVY